MLTGYRPRFATVCILCAVLVAPAVLTACNGSASHSTNGPTAQHGNLLLSAAKFPPATRIQQQNPTNALAQFLFGGFHSNKYAKLGRMNNHGSIQCGSQNVIVRSHVGNQVHSLPQGLVWCQAISIYTSSARAARAAADVRMQSRQPRVVTGGWRVLSQAGNPGTKQNVTYTYASLANNRAVAEQLCVTAAAGSFVTTLNKYCDMQRSGLASMLPTVSYQQVAGTPIPRPTVLGTAPSPTPTPGPPPPTPIPILETARNNAGVTSDYSAPAADTCQNQRYLANDAPPWEWMPIINPTDQLEQDVSGASGTAILWPSNPTDISDPQDAISTNDLWFTHPFGWDHEFAIVVDPKYRSLLAPSNDGRDPNGNIVDNDFYSNTLAGRGVDPYLRGVLGLEVDSGLVPHDPQPPDNLSYRVLQSGDRVAVFGRWIADCGHTDFHSEIHPPLLLVHARQVGGSRRIVAAAPPPETVSRLIGRPYVVDQSWPDGTLRRHITNEFLNLLGVGPGCPSYDIIDIPCSDQVEVKSSLLPMPFQGFHVFDFIVRAPAGNQVVARHLVADFHFTVRHGVTVQVIPNDAESVHVFVQFNSVQYQPPPPATARTANVSASEVFNQAGSAFASFLVSPLGEATTLVGVCAILAIDQPSLIPGLLALIPQCIYATGIVAANGFDYTVRDAPAATSTLDDQNVVKDFPVSSLSGNTPQSVDDSQPFPIYGYLDLRWVTSAVNKGP